MTTNEELKELMRAHGMRTYSHYKNKDIERIAELLHVSKYAVVNWLSGSRNMPEGYLKLLKIELGK